ncbi:hypothetical protein RSAG8_04277, partial [Rhizoctonia solani AG-8 WAC10335]
MAQTTTCARQTDSKGFNKAVGRVQDQRLKIIKANNL